MKYPKILIIGHHYFDLRSGGGITLTNLFKGWDNENIAFAGERIDNPDYSICKQYYQLGSLETRSRFPFNLSRWGKLVESGNVREKAAHISFTSSNNTKKSYLRNTYLSLLHYTGLYHYKQRYKISKQFLSWIKEYSPDIIYSMLGSLELIRFVDDLRKTLGIPVAVHIMDDWPVTVTMSQKGPFQSFWHTIIDKEFRHLLANAKILLSISESMSDEYKIRYGQNFIPFHNPIDLKFWVLPSKKNYELNDTFIILYAGRIGSGVQNCFFDIAEAIHSLVIKGLKIEFHIQATNYDTVLNELAKFDFIKLKTVAPYNNLPGIFAKSDLLLLPNDFDRKSILFLKHSMPTKASEYMVSGSPILLYSGIETAVTRHAMKHQWAYVVSFNNIEKLKSAIFEIYEKKELRIKLGNTAREYAINNYDGAIIREQFRKSFILE